MGQHQAQHGRMQHNRASKGASQCYITVVGHDETQPGRGCAGSVRWSRMHVSHEAWQQGALRCRTANLQPPLLRFLHGEQRKQSDMQKLDRRAARKK